MRTRTALLATALAALALTGAAQPARAADTLVTFVVAEDAGPLSISAPASAALPEGASGSLVDGVLGTVTVIDQRGTLVGGWSTSVQASKAVRTGGGGEIPASAISYETGAASTTPVSLALNTSSAATALGGVLPVPAVTSVGLGKSTATWTPTVNVAVPEGTPAGTYTFTLTHSVS